MTVHSDRRGFTIRQLDENGKPVTVQYEAIRTDPSHLRKRETPFGVDHLQETTLQTAKGKARKKGKSKRRSNDDPRLSDAITPSRLTESPTQLSTVERPVRCQKVLASVCLSTMPVENLR